MDYEAYLFDFDYTLANSEKGIVMCFQHVFERNGFKGIEDEAIKKTIGLTLEEAFMLLTGIKDRKTIAGYRKQYVEKSDEVMVANTKLFPEVLPMLRKLKEKGAKTGIISTKYRYRIESTTRLYGMDELIDLIVGGEDVKAAKPSPEGVWKALDQLKCDREKTLYIGDSLVDARTAENAGVSFAAVTTGTTTAADFDEVPHVKIMGDLSELAD
ncbi:HAD-IA family hydrolase [Eubacterium sp. 1001713B170207_170306_E7]|uniref:HAD-IA family hydrolase n=1 Tax=Eubacterium sp. 1001713B170207_170306_E7 TaxID=2787097 RepID=UPI00189BA76E|nr:HAD-IA family hydrolase [Eubacterium sp. 1001713B170207_170306_E7]